MLVSLGVGRAGFSCEKSGSGGAAPAAPQVQGVVVMVVFTETTLVQRSKPCSILQPYQGESCSPLPTCPLVHVFSLVEPTTISALSYLQLHRYVKFQALLSADSLALASRLSSKLRAAFDQLRAHLGSRAAVQAQCLT